MTAPATVRQSEKVQSSARSRNPFFQPKLNINAPNDPYEQEADAVADQVMRMPMSGIQKKAGGDLFFSPSAISISTIHRKCEHCEREEEEKKMQRKESSNNEIKTDHTLDSYISTLSTAGKPLGREARNFFEPKFGYDFSNVKVHTDTVAAKSAESINAKAYTTGNNIVFNQGMYEPTTENGKRLLGHELTHVLQANTNKTVRRAASDYQVRDIFPGAAGEADFIFFNIGSTTVAASELPKIAPLATPPGRDLDLNGFASEEGSTAERTTISNNRISAVSAALVAAGHTAARNPIARPSEGIGDINYRHRRSVQVLPAGATPASPCSVAGSDVATGTALTACEASFTGVNPTAVAIVDAAERDIVTTPTPAANAVVTRFFSGVPRATVDANVTAIAAQVRNLSARHQCHTTCDGGCGRPAYNDGTGVGPTGAMMTLCPGFVSAGATFRTETLIHEAAHGNPVMDIEDIAYSNTRLIDFLATSPSLSVKNTDSYVLLMRLVHTPGSMTPGPVTTDTLSGMTGVGPGSDTEQTQRAAAWLESWLNYGDFDTEILYDTIDESLRAGAWVTVDAHEFNIETMHRLATAFSPDLVDPGPDGAPRSTPPTVGDKVKVVAIHDRFDQMYDVINQTPITITRGAVEGWGSLATIPRLTRTVTVEPSFFALSQLEQVKHLFRLMVSARSDISVAFRAKYVNAIDLIHTHRGLGP